MQKRVLLLGNTGKLGSALADALSGPFVLHCANSETFDALHFASVERLVEAVAPDVVVNTVAMVGIDPCEAQPERAFLLNTLYPARLARLCASRGCVLVHFSTDAVFDDSKGAPLDEEDVPRPLHIYGATKYGGDAQVMAHAGCYYLFRVPILFGPAPRLRVPQFVEKMLARAAAGYPLRIADDIVSSPTYTRDIAGRVVEFLLNEAPYGLYHLTNEGVASLYDLMVAVAEEIGLGVPVVRASCREFPAHGRKNTFTPLTSVRTLLLRPWREAVADYAKFLRCQHVRSTKDA